jgi:hypothetical protein
MYCLFHGNVFFMFKGVAILITNDLWWCLMWLLADMKHKAKGQYSLEGISVGSFMTCRTSATCWFYIFYYGYEEVISRNTVCLRWCELPGSEYFFVLYLRKIIGHESSMELCYMVVNYAIIFISRSRNFWNEYQEMPVQCDMDTNTIELLSLKIWHEHFVISSDSIIGRS